jgi:hypothetical protein
MLVKMICQDTTRVLYIQWERVLSTTHPIYLKELFTNLLIMQHLLKFTSQMMITLSSLD